VNNVLKTSNNLREVRRELTLATGFQCAGCGEWNEVAIDQSAGCNQVYVEDCQVCCKPNVLHVSYDPDLETIVIAAELE